MPIKTIIVHDFGEYVTEISRLSSEICDSSIYPKTLWFRAQPNYKFSLLPTLFRGNDRAGNQKPESSYTVLHHAEDIRLQHYIAKNYHLLSIEPSSRVEWLAVMQHHLMKTRMMDWSESSLHSLLFAVEPFLDSKLEKQRTECTPCVWILEPQKLNRKILQYLTENQDLVEKLIDEISFSKDEKDLFFSFVINHSGLSDFLDCYAEGKDTRHIDYIFNLSSIGDDLTRERPRLKEILLSGNPINPFYYLISRIYSDGFLLNDRILPPLSVVHPYHSERIRAQKGVFSVFPFYEEKKDDQDLRNNHYNPDGMEHNQMAQDCLTQIIIENPQKIALQMMQNGMYQSWLYPELPVVSSEIENHQIY